MKTSERRLEIIRILCRRRHETISNLASEFNVSTKTIRNDINEITEYIPIYTLPGRNVGGIHVIDDYSMDKMYFSEEETDVLTKVLQIHEAKTLDILSEKEISVLNRILSDYKKPSLSDFNKKRRLAT